MSEQEMYDKVAEVLQIKYRMSSSGAEGLIQCTSDEWWEEKCAEEWVDEYDVAELLFNGDFE